MPGKGRRVASRQAQLGRRRRKPARPEGGIPSSQAPAAVAESESVDAVDTQPERPVAPDGVSREAVLAARVPAAPQRVPRSRAERPTAYNYVGAEVRRILIMSGVLLAVLIVLAIFV